jgi:two-component system phosphate regulon response regulator PhoB
MNQTILIIDDEAEAREVMKSNLANAGFTVVTADDGSEALNKAKSTLPDLILLDLMLSEIDGFDVCRILRHDEQTRAIPVIMVTAKASEIDRVLGLALGADDYVTKPFSPRELVLRVKALLRRRGANEGGSEQIRVGNLVVDIPRHSVQVEGRSIELTPTEFSILTLLAQNQGRVLSREQLLRDLWEHETTVDNRTVDTHMRRLREKLGPAARFLETVRGFGYRFVEN